MTEFQTSTAVSSTSPSASGIVRRTTGCRRRGATNWERVQGMREADIERAAASDPDNPPWTQAEIHAALLRHPAAGDR